MFRIGRFLTLFLVLAACSQPLVNLPNPLSEALITNADLDRADLELAPTETVVSGTEEGTAPDGVETELADAEGVMGQAVLPGVGGFLSYIRKIRGSSSTWQLWLADQRTDRKTLVYSGNRALTSAATTLAGDTLFFTVQSAAGSSNHEVYRLKLSGNVLTRITNTASAEADVSVSADGKTLVWGGVDAATGRRVVVLRDYGGTGFSQILSGGGGEQFEPTVSADGAYIALVRKAASTQVMRFRRGDNSYRTVATPSGSVTVWAPSVSDGGLKVAWREDTKATQASAVKVKTVSSGATVTAVRSADRLRHPHLTADGEYLTYSKLVNGTYNVTTKNLVSGQYVRLTTDTSASVTNGGAFWQKVPPSGADLSVACSPDALTLAKATTTTVTCTASSGPASSATVSVTGLPSNLAAEPFVRSVTVSANGAVSFAVAVSAEADAALGTQPFGLNVAAGGAAATARLQVTVVPASPRVRIIYLVPSDKEPNALAVKGMERAIRHLQSFYYKEMATGRAVSVSYPVVEVVRTPHRADWYSTHPNGDYGSWFWLNTLEDAFALTGGGFGDQENIWLYYIDAEIADGQGSGANDSVGVLPAWDVRGVADGGQDGICRWVGGLGHELGHALLLPHPPGYEGGESGCPERALMWLGYLSYPDAFLTADDKEHLASNPFFAARPTTARLFGCSSLTSQVFGTGENYGP